MFITFTGIFVAINFKSSDFALFQHWRDMPNYAILVDIRDRPSSQITYVPEENIEVITNTKVCTWSFKFVPSGKHSRTLKLKVSHQSERFSNKILTVASWTEYLDYFLMPIMFSQFVQ